MPKKRLAMKQMSQKHKIASCKGTKKSGALKVKGNSTLKSSRFLGGYE